MEHGLRSLIPSSKIAGRNSKSLGLFLFSGGFLVLPPPSVVGLWVLQPGCDCDLAHLFAVP